MGSDPFSSRPADWPLVAPRYHITREIFSLLALPEVYTSVSLLRPSVSPRDRTHCSLRRAWTVLGGSPKTRLKHVGMGACSGYTRCMTVSACHCGMALDISLSLSGPRRTEVGRSQGGGPLSGSGVPRGTRTVQSQPQPGFPLAGPACFLKKGTVCACCSHLVTEAPCRGWAFTPESLQVPGDNPAGPAGGETEAQQGPNTGHQPRGSTAPGSTAHVPACRADARGRQRTEPWCELRFPSVPPWATEPDGLSLVTTFDPRCLLSHSGTFS